MIKVSELYGPRWFTAGNLQGEITVTISSVSSYAVSSGERRISLSFKGTQERLALTHAQAFAMADIAGDDADKWVGVAIKLSLSAVNPARKEIVILPAE